MAVNRSDISPDLIPGIKMHYFGGIKGARKDLFDMFDKVTSDKAQELYQESQGLSLHKIKTEGENAEQDRIGTGFQTQVRNIPFALTLSITHEAIKDTQYKEVMAKSKNFGKSASDTIQEKLASVFNNGFDPLFKTGDGEPVYSQNHIISKTGELYSNTPSVGGSPSETTLTTMVTQIADLKDSAGLRIGAEGQMIIAAPALDVQLQKLLFSTVSLESTGGDQLNPFARRNGRLPQGYRVSPFLSSQTAWYVRTSVPDSVLYQSRENPRLMEDTSVMNMNLNMTSYFRCAAAVVDPRGTYGDPGV